MLFCYWRGNGRFFQIAGNCQTILRPHVARKLETLVSEENQQLDVAKALREHLQSLRGFGVTHLPASGPESVEAWADRLAALGGAEQVREAGPRALTSERPQSRPAGSLPDTQPAPSTAKPTAKMLIPEADESTNPYGASLGLDERQAELTVLNDAVKACTQCEELCANRTQTVFGVGNVAPRLAFLGEGPGADEDRLGEPFVGAAGQLLNKIIGAMKLSREEVYILNTVKCRPPGNRNPSETELSNCFGYAVRQLEILQPEFIVCLGSVAARTLLKTQKSIGRMRGQFYDYRDSRVVVTYHPAYLLRTPSAKVQVWEDMKMVMAEMGIER